MELLKWELRKKLIEWSIEGSSQSQSQMIQFLSSTQIHYCKKILCVCARLDRFHSLFRGKNQEIPALFDKAQSCLGSAIGAR